MKISVENLASQLVDARLATAENLRGCTAAEIHELQDAFGIALPVFYVNFLLKMGHGAGNFMKGSSIFYPELFKLRGYAEQYMQEIAAKFDLHKDDFVFFGHQGYQYAYFRVGLADDPPVWFLSDDSETPDEKWNSLSDFFQMMVDFEKQ